MIIIRIAVKEFMRNIRDTKIIIIMTVLPLAIIFLLGIATSNIFTNSEISMGDMNIEYLVIGDKTIFTKDLENILSEVSQNNLIESKNIDDSKNLLSNNVISNLLVINEDKKIIEVYKNNLNTRNSFIVESIVDSYVQRKNINYEISKITTDVKISDDNFVIMEKINSKISFSALDYYGVSMCVIFILYGIPMPLASFIRESKTNTLGRMTLAPIGKSSLLFGQILGSSVIAILQIVIVMGGTLLMFNVQWGTNPLIPFTILSSLAILSVSIGIFLGIIFKSEDIANIFVHIFIVIVGMFGGTYMPLEHLGLFGRVGKYFSPVWWAMNGIFNSIITGESKIAIESVLINLISAFILLIISSILLKKKEGLLNV